MNSNFRYPTANKVSIICMEILDSIYQLSYYYGCHDVKDLISNKIHSEDREDLQMLTKLNRMFSVVYKYRLLVESTAENPIRKALVLDTFSFSLFKGREENYFKHTTTSVSDLLVQFHSEEHINSVTQSQVVEIKDIFNKIDETVAESSSIAAVATKTESATSYNSTSYKYSQRKRRYVGQNVQKKHTKP